MALNPSSRWYYPLHWLVLILLGLGIYSETFGYDFAFDDMQFVVNNYCITRFDHIHYIWNIFPQTRAIGFYSFAFNYFTNQLHPQGYHIFNFAVHLLAVGLVWGGATLLFKIAGGSHPELAYVIAVLFLVHPCQTQAVTYISQRFESMATVFYLGSIYAYLCGRMSSFKPHKIMLFICCGVFAILGIFTKEVTLTIPLMILASEITLFKGNRRNIMIILTVGGLCLLMLLMKLLRTNLNIFIHFHPIPSQSHDGDMITLKSYLLTQMRVFLTFMRLLIWPFQQNLDYDYPLSTGLLQPPLTLIGGCLIGAVFFLYFKLRKKFPIIAFGLAWILITFSINLAPRANVIFEHKLYLISFGFFLSLVSALFIIIRSRILLAALLITMIAGLSFSSFLRNQVWKNELTLWDDTVRKSPHKARPHYNRGLAYYKSGYITQALSDYNKAIEINPKYVEAYINRGINYEAQGKLTDALANYNKAIEINPNLAEAHYNRGNLYLKQNNLKAALLDYNKAIEINPNYTQAHMNRGSIYMAQSKFSQALSDYNKSIEINPGYAEAYYNRGVVFDIQGDLTDAVSDYNKAIEINPNYADAYNNRGQIYRRQSNYTQGVSDFTKAIEINPNYAGAYYNRGLSFVNLGDWTQALGDVHKAEELGYAVDGKFLENLKKASQRGK